MPRTVSHKLGTSIQKLPYDQKGVHDRAQTSECLRSDLLRNTPKLI